MKRRVDWNRNLFVLVCPDAIARQLVEPILKRLQENAFEPIYAKLVWAGPEELDALYRANINFVWDTYRYRQIDQLFRFGPCMAVLVDDLRTTAPESHERLKSLKGYSQPHKADIGTIRRDFGGINSILGLIHTSDSPEEAQRESAIFAGEISEVPDDPSAVWNLVRLTTMARPLEQRGFDQVLGGLRVRIVLAAWNELTEHGRSLAMEWMGNGHEAFAAPGVGNRIVEHLEGGAKHVLAPVLSCEFQPNTPRLDMLEVRRRLAVYSIETDPWEELVLVTSSIFETNRSLTLHHAGE